MSNRCCQLAGTPLGSKRPVHPNDHVNMSQSSNDTFPSATHVAAATNAKCRLIPAVTALRDAIAAKAAEWGDIVKIGRTHMQDATPLTLGQEWSGYAAMLSENLERIEAALAGVYRRSSQDGRPPCRRKLRPVARKVRRSSSRGRPATSYHPRTRSTEHAETHEPR
jgi:fumarate hydratase class II